MTPQPGQAGPLTNAATTASSSTAASLPSRAQVVIIGGGVIGTSVAYHLTALGWTDVLLLEQGTLSCGTTWHAAGLVGQLRASEAGTRLVQYSCELYDRLEAETGLSAGYRRCGGFTVARTSERMVALRRTAASAAAYGLDCELLTPEQAGSAIPSSAPTISSARSGSRRTAAPTPPTSLKRWPKGPSSAARRSSSGPACSTSGRRRRPAACG